MDKWRSLNKLKKSLPVDPVKREAVLKAYIVSSPAMTSCKKKLVKHSEYKTAEKILVIYKYLSVNQNWIRNDDSRMTMNVLTASVSGEDISDPASDRKIAKILRLEPRRLFGEKRIRTQILKTEKSCFEITKRKTRSDAVSENVKRTVFDFWCSPSVSRTSSNKKDIKRMRISPKTYSSH